MPEAHQRDLSDLSRVDPARLGSVWPGPALGAAGTWQSEELGDVLSHQLSAPLERPAPVTSPDPALTYGELLLRMPRPPLDALRRVKDWAKPLMARDDGDVPREVAGVLYFAAIVAARTRLGERISDLDDAHLRAGANWALQLPWVAGDTSNLFRDATAYLDRERPPARA